MQSGRGRGRGRGRSQTLKEFYSNQYSDHFPEINQEGWIIPRKSVKTTVYGPSSSSSSESSLKDILMTQDIDSYLPNTVTEETVLYIEQYEKDMDPWEIQERYLQNQSHIPHQDTFRYIYEFMLKETGSAEFTHTVIDESRKNSPIRFSKVIIKNVIRPSHWGLHLNQNKTLSSVRDRKYNYWDYQKAFYNTFFYQNPIKGHTWFFKLCSDLLSGHQNDLPTWFYVWWDTFGPGLDILPTSLLSVCKEWISIHQTISEFRQYPISRLIARFFISFSIPWIWRWTFVISDPITGRSALTRKYHYKWWKGINPNLSKLEDIIKQHITTLQPKIPEKEDNLIPQLYSHIQQIDPTLSKEQLLRKSIALLKAQLANEETVGSSSQKDDTSMHSADTECLAGESQDPDLDNLEFSNFWDQYEDNLLDKIDKGKKSK